MRAMPVLNANVIQRFLTARHGNVLMLTGFVLFVLIGAAGAGVDFGRQQLVRSKLQQSTDAAALAAASMPEGTSTQAMQDAALRVYNMNFPANYLGAVRPLPTVTMQNGVTVSATVPKLPMYFMKMVGIDSRQAGASTTVQQDAKSSSKPYDVILVLDNSGSMAACQDYKDYEGPKKGCLSTTRIQALIDTSKKLVDNILGKSSDSRVSLQTWSDVPLVGHDFSKDGVAIKGWLNGMKPDGNTDSSYALRTVIKDFVPHFDSSHLPIVILLTDGVNTSYTAPGKKTCTNGACVAQANQDTLKYCSDLKSKMPPVTVYTIAFGQDVYSNNTVRSLLSGCATQMPAGTDNTNQFFFPAADGASLDAAFVNIFTQLGKLRITD